MAHTVESLSIRITAQSKALATLEEYTQALEKRLSVLEEMARLVAETPAPASEQAGEQTQEVAPEVEHAIHLNEGEFCYGKLKRPRTQGGLEMPRGTLVYKHESKYRAFVGTKYRTLPEEWVLERKEGSQAFANVRKMRAGENPSKQLEREARASAKEAKEKALGKAGTQAKASEPKLTKQERHEARHNAKQCTCKPTWACPALQANPNLDNWAGFSVKAASPTCLERLSDAW